jgi:hypothetical protein
LLDTKLQDTQSSKKIHLEFSNVPGDKASDLGKNIIQVHHLLTSKSASFSSLHKLLKLSSFYIYKILLPVPAILFSDRFLLKLSIPELLLYTFVHLTQATSTNLLVYSIFSGCNLLCCHELVDLE